MPTPVIHQPRAQRRTRRVCFPAEARSANTPHRSVGPTGPKALSRHPTCHFDGALGRGAPYWVRWGFRRWPLGQGWSDLERLALCAQRFTPRVSLVPPDGLVLEVKGSLHLFNGVEGLSRALASECASLGLKSMVALAPTPLAALVAARVGKPFVVTEMTRLVGQLMPLPLAALRWPEETLERSARMGVRTIGQVLRLPRAGFARRFGTDSLAVLDRLTGRGADLRERFHARERFRRRRELNFELENQTAILGALAPLLAELGKFLESRQCGVMKLECLLRHRNHEPTSCVLRLAAPVADVRRLTELLGERLNALTLPEPVRSCELRSSSLVRRVFASNSVWQPGEYGGSAGAEATELIERLRARLGPEAVYGLQVLPGHRPENAWGVREPVRCGRAALPQSQRASRGAHGRPFVALCGSCRSRGFCLSVMGYRDGGGLCASSGSRSVSRPVGGTGAKSLATITRLLTFTACGCGSSVSEPRRTAGSFMECSGESGLWHGVAVLPVGCFVTPA